MPKPRTPIRRQANPLPEADRIAHYHAQTGRTTLTPKQQRRAGHKRRAGAGRRTKAIRDALRG